MALDVDQLRQGLEDYRAALERQRNDCRSRYVELQRQFSALFNVYGGAMAEDFRKRWDVTARWFEEYLNKNADLDRFLEERIEKLRQL